MRDPLAALTEALRLTARRYRVNDDIDPFPEAETWAARILAHPAVADLARKAAAYDELHDAATAFLATVRTSAHLIPNEPEAERLAAALAAASPEEEK